MESKRFSPPSDTRVRIRHTWRLLLHTSRSSAGNTTNTMYVQRCASITGCIHTDTALLWVYILSDFFVRCSFSLSQSKSFLHTFFFNSMTEKATDTKYSAIYNRQQPPGHHNTAHNGLKAAKTKNGKMECDAWCVLLTAQYHLTLTRTFELLCIFCVIQQPALKNWTHWDSDGSKIVCKKGVGRKPKIFVERVQVLTSSASSTILLLFWILCRTPLLTRSLTYYGFTMNSIHFSLDVRRMHVQKHWDVVVANKFDGVMTLLSDSCIICFLHFIFITLYLLLSVRTCKWFS